MTLEMLHPEALIFWYWFFFRWESLSSKIKQLHFPEILITLIPKKLIVFLVFATILDIDKIR